MESLRISISINLPFRRLIFEARGPPNESLSKESPSPTSSEKHGFLPQLPLEGRSSIRPFTSRSNPSMALFSVNLLKGEQILNPSPSTKAELLARGVSLIGNYQCKH